MEHLLQRHPSLADTLYKHPSTKRYTRYDEKGNLLECWDKIDSHWYDTTELELAKRQVAALQQELDKMEDDDERDDEQDDEQL